ncbi:MAG: hypothetical protein RBQ97_07210 [Acholeplasma sp.]|nr:hypothetical protein [Acholeplasma sp.]
MLFKLIKHEFKASYRSYLIFYLIVIALAFLGPVMYNIQLEAVASLLVPFVFIAIFGVFIFTLVNVFKSFGERIFGKPGYLLFSVPAKTRDIFLSRVLVNIVWMVSSIIVSVIAVYIFIVVLGGEAVAEGIFDTLKNLFNAVEPKEIILGLLSSGISFISFMALILLVQSIANTLYHGAKKGLIATILYFVIAWGVSFITEQIYANLTVTQQSYAEMGVGVLLSVIYFGISYYLVDKKLELE